MEPQRAARGIVRSSWKHEVNNLTHDQGIVTQASGNAARSTAVASAEGRLIVDVTDKIFLLEPNKHPLVSLLTNVGKVWDGKAWKGQSIMKLPTGKTTGLPV